MRKLFILAAVAMLAGCKQNQMAFSHFRSSMFGLNRIVTLYSADGHILRTWAGNYQVEDKGGTFRFLDNGRAVIISGTVVIEETELPSRGRKEPKP